ncbi:MAG: alpha-ketoglutarate-dependent dioxygenase AlkB [Alphaproteobacteria bacterium]|nr:alpha-ketoglutarate-dependent dioxygenase AlkB [Alphaproteobacteria bacterium]
MTLPLFRDMAPASLPGGVAHVPGALTLTEQAALLDDIAAVVAEAPFYRPRMRNGTPLINQMTNCGPLGWISDSKGYRYEPSHPVTGERWPAIPRRLLALSDRIIAGLGLPPFVPDACLVNAYAADGKLGLHQDYDECDFAHPIVSVSLGADAIFLIGGQARGDRPETLLLHSGDVVVLHGPSRTRFHGVRRVLPDTAPLTHPLLAEAARINLTLRRAR